MNRTRHPRSAALGSLLAAIALVAVACTPSADPSETTTSTVPTPTTSALPVTTTSTTPKIQRPYGGEAVIADDDEPPTLNSFAPGGDDFVVSIISQSYNAGVYEIDGFTLELIPELVTELPTTSNGLVTVNANGTMTVRYEIREEAQWEDGTPISGDDFRFTYDLIMNPDLPISKTTYFDIDPESIVVGDKSFEYTLTAPTVQYELLFRTVLPAHAIDPATFLEDWNDKMWPSAGPFVFDEWVAGDHISVVRNENYWKADAETDQQLPYLDGVTFKFIRETEDIVEAFKAREVDIIQPNPASSTIDALLALEGDGARVEVLSGPVWEHLNWQFGQKRLVRNETSCNDNYNMRKAVALAIDKSILTEEILAGQVEPLDSYVDAFSPTLSQESWAQYQPDVQAAKDAYAVAVAETGVECSVVFSSASDNDARVAMSGLFVGMFEAAGIPYENNLQSNEVFFGEWLYAGLWDLGEWAWVGSPGLSGLVGIHDVFDPEGPPPIGHNYYRWGTTELDPARYEGYNAIYADSNESSVQNVATERFAALRDEMNSTVDDAELVTLIHEAEQLLADNLVILPLYARRVIAAVWEDEITGFRHNPTQATHTWNLEQWYRTDLEN